MLFQSLTPRHKRLIRWSLFGLLTALIALVALPISQKTTAVAAPDTNTTTYLPLIYNRTYNRAPNAMFGVQLYDNTLTSNKYYNDLYESRTTWIRIPVRWRDAESTLENPKNYNWNSIDKVLDAAVPDGDGFRIIGTIYYAPTWAVPEPYHPRAVLKDEALPHFAQFLQALAKRYDGSNPNLPTVTHWEFYNEPDITTEPGGTILWGDRGDKYAQMLATAYPAIKAGNPNAQVLFGGIAYDAFVDQSGSFVREFLDDVLSAGGGNHFDMMNFHFYPGFSATWTNQPWPAGGPGLLEKATYIRNKLQNEYGLNKPMVITESGWFSDSPPSFSSSPEIQARYVLMLHTQAFASDIDIMIWWMLYDIGIGYNDTGLVTNSTPPVRKPAFNVYTHMVEEMRTAEFIRKLPTAETGTKRLEVYQFNDAPKQRTLYIAWLNVSNHSSLETKTLRLPASAITLKSMEGNIIATITDGNDGTLDGQVTLSISNRPVYLEVSP